MYHIGIAVYTWLFKLVAIFHTKAGKMVIGQKNTWSLLNTRLDKRKEWLWFHAASLGEFEQGRPIMERIRAEHPEYGLLLTFYSPSGYDVRKNYEGADLVCYLPFDRKKNVIRFLDLVKPVNVFFIKYEFWPNYLQELGKRKIPTYLVSGIFRPDQAFFKPFGKSYRKVLESFTHFFVQDTMSVSLLASIGYTTNVTLSGDTRYDRVLNIASKSKRLDVVDAFFSAAKTMGQPILVVGSSWPQDESLVLPYINAHPGIRLIIAPHEIHENHLETIESSLTRINGRYSRTTVKEASNLDCLIIDCFGLLSSIYRYGDVAYIGGGFGNGIHNTLEAAVYGIPVLFGPKHDKFAEAKALLASGGAFFLNNATELEQTLDRLFQSESHRLESGKNAGEMVKNGCGSTENIMKHLF
jgi:3-deoxy-D-manno-octulosonic-acid transferase